MLVEEEPLLLSRRIDPCPHENKTARQLLAPHVDMDLAIANRPPRVEKPAAVFAGRVLFPRPEVPHDHVAAPVLTRGNDALEVEVLDRVVLDVKCGPPHGGVERRTLGHRPTDQHPVNLEPEVVMEPACSVPLHDKTPGPSILGPLPGLDPARFGGFREVPLLPVTIERVGRRASCLEDPGGDRCPDHHENGTAHQICGLVQPFPDSAPELEPDHRQPDAHGPDHRRRHGE